jgi:hypothetical protein
MHWSNISKTYLGNGVSRPAFTNKRLSRKFFIG